MQQTIERVTTLIGAHFYGHGLQHAIKWLLTDSRSLAFPETTLFFALRTALGDGHRYIDELYRRGVRHFVVEYLPNNYEQQFPEAGFLMVQNTRKALQRLAERHREEYHLPVVGITGSNGKTVVKEWLYHLLTPQYVVTRSPRSYNSQIGVPLSVWLLDEQSEVGIFEAGISERGEMEALRAIIQPTIGIMTNVGEAHQENFETYEQKCLEKISLFKDCEAVVYCADNNIVANAIEATESHYTRLSWSRSNRQAWLYICNECKEERHTLIEVQCQNRCFTLKFPFTDVAALENALHATTAALYMGVEPEKLAQRALLLEPVAMRLEVKQGVRGLTLINDSYNSDIHSLDIAIDFMQRRQASDTKCTLILSDLLQSGLPAEELYSRIASMIEHRGVCRFIGIGTDIQAIAPHLHISSSFFANTRQLIESGVLENLHHELVLVKGARNFNFEQIISHLSLRVHETILEVNLEALASNLDHYRSFLQPDTRMVCMVKASAYGAGSIEIAKTLQDRGVDYLAVATADEGAELRAGGITAGIIVMNPEMSSFDTLFAHHLEPEIYSFALLEALIRAAEREGITHFPVHIKIDTGMHRLGFHPGKDMPVLIDRLRHQTALLPRSVFSHFVGSDSEEFNAFTQQQFDCFDKASRMLQHAFPHQILRHICNSAAIARFPQYHLDMVRLGIGLYGVNPTDNTTLHNVSSLRTTILQIRELPAGETVGYSRKTRLEKPSRIAALPIGYADGLNRRLGNRKGHCLVNGKPAPYVGNICMDVCMIDVTDIECNEGDTVEIFGNELPPAQLAEWLETIPYEILTAVSGRVKRIYYL